MNQRTRPEEDRTKAAIAAKAFPELLAALELNDGSEEFIEAVHSSIRIVIEAMPRPRCLVAMISGLAALAAHDGNADHYSN